MFSLLVCYSPLTFYSQFFHMIIVENQKGDNGIQSYQNWAKSEYIRLLFPSVTCLSFLPPQFRPITLRWNIPVLINLCHQLRQAKSFVRITSFFAPFLESKNDGSVVLFFYILNSIIIKCIKYRLIFEELWLI